MNSTKKTAGKNPSSYERAILSPRAHGVIAAYRLLMCLRCVYPVRTGQPMLCTLKRGCTHRHERGDARGKITGTNSLRRTCRMGTSPSAGSSREYSHDRSVLTAARRNCVLLKHLACSHGVVATVGEGTRMIGACQPFAQIPHGVGGRGVARRQRGARPDTLIAEKEVVSPRRPTLKTLVSRPAGHGG